MLIHLLWVILGFVVVIKGADLFVQGAGSIARKMGVTPFVVGLTIVAIGTSAPEFFVNVIAAWNGSTELAVGNVLGSNIVNILLALGIAACVGHVSIKKQTVWREIPFALLSCFVIIFLGMDAFFTGESGGGSVITRGDGLVLLSFFVIFMVYTFGLTKAEENDEEESQIDMYPWMQSALYTVGGIVGLVVGGRLVVEHAIDIATFLGWSENLIGLTIVAMGTSLPEIVTSIVAVRKGQADLVVGGVIGSTIFNAFFILGSTAFVSELTFGEDNIFDAGFLMIISIILFISMFLGRRHVLERSQGILFIFLYIGYIGYALARG